MNYAGSCEAAAKRWSIDTDTVCCDSCHEDAGLGFDLIDLEIEEEQIYFEVCCAVHNEIERRKNDEDSERERLLGIVTTCYEALLMAKAQLECYQGDSVVEAYRACANAMCAAEDDYYSRYDVCIICGDRVCKVEGCTTHPDGCQLDSGCWTCSYECWEEGAKRALRAE